jgi:hypothetical protein
MLEMERTGSSTGAEFDESSPSRRREKYLGVVFDQIGYRTEQAKIGYNAGNKKRHNPLWDMAF